MSEVRSQVAERLRALRRARNLSQEDVAAAVGARGKEISRYETGQTFPEIERLERLAHFYGLELRDMFDPGASTDWRRPLSPGVDEIVALVESKASDPTFLRRVVLVVRALLKG